MRNSAVRVPSVQVPLGHVSDLRKQDSVAHGIEILAHGA